jgi:AcrR family transcriptional regulator
MNTATAPTESKVATKQRLIEAAEHLFADDGFEKVSVRDITNRAGANVAAVNYHFGSREGLVEIVMARYINPISEERIARLEGLERKAGGKPVPIEELVEAFARPFTTQIRRSELSEKIFFKLMGRLFGDQCKLPPTVESGLQDMRVRFHRAFSKSLPGMPPEEIWWRTHLMGGSLIYTLAHSETLQRISSGASGTPTMEQIVSRFIRFASAGMRQDHVAGEEEEGVKRGPQVEFTF